MRSGLASGSTCTLVPILILSVRAAIAVPRTSGLAARARRLSKCSSASHITSRPYSSLASTMSNPAAEGGGSASEKRKQREPHPVEAVFLAGVDDVEPGGEAFGLAVARQHRKL